jgi:hypothetical protein
MIALLAICRKVIILDLSFANAARLAPRQPGSMILPEASSSLRLLNGMAMSSPFSR